VYDGLKGSCGVGRGVHLRYVIGRDRCSEERSWRKRSSSVGDART
jgi:hypothetical protein